MRLPATFRFSPFLTFTAVLLALVMCIASRWQWNRYKFKVALVESYQNNKTSPPLKFVPANGSSDDYSELLNKKVSLSGTYDFQHQFIILNRQHATGPGAWLLTPLRMENGSSILISRGFIPYADVIAKDWQKYNFAEHEDLIGVVVPSIASRTSIVPSSIDSTEAEASKWQSQWLFPDLQTISKQFPYPINTQVFIQRLGGPPTGQFPAESIQIDVPPSTHFGYTFEWILLAIGTLIVAFLLQAFPRERRRTGSARTHDTQLTANSKL